MHIVSDAIVSFLYYNIKYEHEMIIRKRLVFFIMSIKYFSLLMRMNVMTLIDETLEVCFNLRKLLKLSFLTESLEKNIIS